MAYPYFLDGGKGRQMKYEITAEMNLKNLIFEAREVAQAMNDFADNLERIEEKYEEDYELVDLGNGLFEKRYLREVKHD